MPTLARWYIKTALIYLVLALLTGIMVAAWPMLGWSSAFAVLQQTYIHLFVVGWLTQLIFGVAFWLFPRHSRERPHGNTLPMRVAYGLINVGLLLRALAEPFHTWHPASGWGGVLAVSALLQWTAGMLFVFYLWNRVKQK